MVVFQGRVRIAPTVFVMSHAVLNREGLPMYREAFSIEPVDGECQKFIEEMQRR